MPLSSYRHYSDDKERFFTIRSKKYFVVERRINENHVDIYVGILRKEEDYRSNKGHDISRLKIVGSKKERKRIKKVLKGVFYSEHGKDNLEINRFNFIGCKS